MQTLTETIVRENIRAEGPYVSLSKVSRRLRVTHTVLWDFIGAWPDLVDLVSDNCLKISDRRHVNLGEGAGPGLSGPVYTYN